ncbi:unnamed protein product [Adineta steineri]|uniref:Plus3 domain-containing protein n=1 Tax=Adineta steineri TaxID=433720 RepID=A0A814LU54_9BILA|nr:unnamed protein product [Adineta steineri]CAF3501403.1 unnamed protein product [Adineta steineri]
MSKSDIRKRQRTTSGNSDSDSDSDSSRSKNIFTDGYDENYRGDSNDRAWLKTLSEREREAELLKRHEQREIIKRREEINKRLKSKAEESGIKSEEEGEIDDQDDDSDNDKSNKTSIRKSNLYDNDIYAEDDDDDDYPSSTNRRKQINATKQKETEHSKSLQLLVEGRKKKQDERIKKTSIKPEDASSSDEDNPDKSSKTNEKDEKWKVTDVYQTSSEDDDDDDDDSRDKRRARSRSPDDRTLDSRDHDSKRKRCTPITTKDQLKSMILSRFRMEKWCHSPFFSDVAKGSFVRINIGQNNGEPVYRVCEISDVVETGKIYNLGSTRTNKGLRLKHGNNERVFRLEYVSNNEISDNEFQRWREAMIRQGISLPTLDDIDKKMKEIEKCKHYVLSNNDITKIVQEKKRFRKAPTNYAMSKNDLLKEIEMAKDENDIEREGELRKQLTEMEERASELDRKRSENISVMA